MGKPKKPSVYDAVAGRISSSGFIPKQLTIASTRDKPSSSTLPVPPETVLFRHKNAPTRYAESDIYFANERESRNDLPESDLLKALHCYSADFYARATANQGFNDWRSLDETALLALGILVEEACRGSLGDTGDLVFTEGEEIITSESASLAGRQADSSSRTPSTSRARKRRRVSRPPGE